MIKETRYSPAMLWGGRVSSGLTSKQVARAMHVKAKDVKAWERPRNGYEALYGDQRRASFDQLQTLATLYGVPIAKFYKADG